MCRRRWSSSNQYIEVAKAVMARARYDVAGMVVIIPGIEVARPR